MKKLAAAFGVASALTLLCAGVYFYTFAPDYSAGFLLSLGKRAESGGHTGRAAYFYEQSLALNPYSVKARLQLCSLLRSHDEHAHAEKLLREGISLLPSKTSFYIELSALLIDDGRLGEAIESLDSASGGVAGLRLGSLRPSVAASPASGVYTQPVSFCISVEPGCSYYYTLDGSEPDLSSELYTAPLSLSASLLYRIRVVALGSSALPSRIYEYVFDLTGYQPQAVTAGICFSAFGAGESTPAHTIPSVEQDQLDESSASAAY